MLGDDPQGHNMPIPGGEEKEKVPNARWHKSRCA